MRAGESAGPLTIEDWMALAVANPQAWQKTLNERLRRCARSTRRRVLCDLIEAPQPLPSGPLAGTPYVLKDLFDWRGHPTRCGSILPPFVQHRAEVDAEIVSYFSRLGASCCGKTQLNEFAYGLSGENPHYGNCLNPLDPTRLSGGSSSGSAWMVAAGVVPLAIGTDTGGSIRVPAAWCGIYGMRWQPGWLLRGCYPLATEFDTVGWFTRTASDMALTLRCGMGEKEQLADTSPPSGLACIPVGGVDAALRKPLARIFTQLGLTSNNRLLQLPSLQQAADAFTVLQSQQAYEQHQYLLEQYGDHYDPQVRERLMRGRDWTGQQVSQARAVQAKWREWLEDYFGKYNVLCLPACPQAAPHVNGSTPELRNKTLALTALASLTGKPVLTVPLQINDHQSIGIQCLFAQSAPTLPLQVLERVRI
jgi:Asp-tRNA(Asn)/Glu-tRNA(Gln) amidotransferase A subunit family amidase